MKIDNVIHTNKAWAVKTEIKDHSAPFLMGIFYCHRGELPAYQDGMRICLFRTRRQARDALKNIKLRPAKVIKVDIRCLEVT